jgi:predicted dehydrogenase
MHILNIVVVGTGMFSTGRGTSGFGTILPAISEWKRAGASIGRVTFVGTNGKHSSEAKDKFRQLALETGVSLDITVLPMGSVLDPEAYKKVIAEVPRPACAIVVVPDHLHFKVLKDCLEEGLPALVVKPLAPTVSEAKELIRIAQDKKLYTAVEFHKRWDKANLMIRDAMTQNKIGDPLYILVEYSQRKSIPTGVFKAWSSQSSILQYLGIHYIDIVLFYTNATPIRVMATGQKNWLVKQGIDTWDAIQCVIEWELPSGARFVQTVLTNWIDPETTSAMSDQKIKIVGTKGRFESDQKERGQKIVVDGSGIEEPNPDFCMVYGDHQGGKQWKGYGIDSITTFLNDVVDINNSNITLEQLQEIRPVFTVGLVSTAVVEAAHLSLEQDSIWIPVDNSGTQT